MTEAGNQREKTDGTKGRGFGGGSGVLKLVTAPNALTIFNFSDQPAGLADPFRVAVGSQLRAAADPELLEDRVQMCLDRALADE